jgi:hypothetical protein
MPIDRTNCLTELVCEAIEAGNNRCPECHDTAPGDKLYVYSTRRGFRLREHAGAFCSKDCHDVYNGLKPRR